MKKDIVAIFGGKKFMIKIANNQICPVCGKRVKLVEIESDPDSGPGFGWHSWQVICDECGGRGPVEEYGPSDRKKQYAINGWNKLIGAANGIELEEKQENI